MWSRWIVSLGIALIALAWCLANEPASAPVADKAVQSEQYATGGQIPDPPRSPKTKTRRRKSCSAARS